MAAIQLWGTQGFKQYSGEVNHDLYTPRNKDAKSKGKKKQVQVEDCQKRYEQYIARGQAGTSHQGGGGHQAGMSREDAAAALIGFWKYVDQWMDPPNALSTNPIQKVTDWLNDCEEEQGTERAS